MTQYSTVGTYRSINAQGRVTINRRASDAGVVLSGAELDKRIKTGLFRIKQFTEAVANLKRLRAQTAQEVFVPAVTRVVEVSPARYARSGVVSL